MVSAPVVMTFAQTQQETDVVATQDVSVANISDEDRQVGNIVFTPRWGAVSTLASNDVTILFADCLDDEMAVSGMNIFESADVIQSQSFAVGTADNVMWVTVVENTGNSPQAVGIGVICAGDSGTADDYDLDVRTKTVIDDTVKRFIVLQGDTITNINNIISIRQLIVQNAIQIANIVGNNNTVNQVITQSANQILNANATNPANIQQIIDQNARQAGIVSGGGSLSQQIEQDASQRANVTGGPTGGAGGTTINQGIGQDASQAANATGGGGVGTIDQQIQQDADQQALLQEQQQQQPPPPAGSPGSIEQLIDQGAEQQAEQEAEIEEEVEEQTEEEGPDDNPSASDTEQGG